MSRLPILFLLAAIGFRGFSQPTLERIADSIMTEAERLYQVEIAALQSSSFIYSKLSLEGLTGQLTYMKGDQVMSIFWTGVSKNPDIKYTFTFDMPVMLSIDDMKIEGEARKMTKHEKMLFRIRNKVLSRIRKDTAFYTPYPDVYLNPAFIDREDRIMVYLLPGMDDKEVVPLGSDYYHVFKPNGKLVSRIKLHQNLITLKTTPETKEHASFSSFHTHTAKSSPFITATDICTLLLFREVTTWQSHVVMSGKYVSFFTMDTGELIIVTKDEFDKIKQRLE